MGAAAPFAVGTIGKIIAGVTIAGAAVSTVKAVDDVFGQPLQRVLGIDDASAIRNEMQKQYAWQQARNRAEGLHAYLTTLKRAMPGYIRQNEQRHKDAYAKWADKREHEIREEMRSDREKERKRKAEADSQLDDRARLDLLHTK